MALLPLDDLREPVEQPVGDRFHEDVDLPAAREPDRECEVVRDAVGEELRSGPVEHLAAVAAALSTQPPETEPKLPPARGDRELRSDWPRRGASSGDDGRHRDPVAARTPALDVG